MKEVKKTPKKHSRQGVFETNITETRKKRYDSYSLGEKLDRLGGGAEAKQTWEQIKATRSGPLKR